VPRYRLDIAYHGSNFSGWQRQPDQRTVQGELELWLGRLLHSPGPIPVTGAGRTDTGVHADHMVAHFNGATAIDPNELQSRLAAALPSDIVVPRITAVSESFHARFSAQSRTYRYRLTGTRSPFDRDRVWLIRSALEVRRLEECAGMILGTHDFSGFCKAGSQKEDNRCRIALSEWRTAADEQVFQISANRFLHEMVRLLVGTMVAVAVGRLPRERISEIIKSGDVRLCGDAAPPHGLTLDRIEYPPESGHPAISVETAEPETLLPQSEPEDEEDQ
jgi:tRNA pseudouridine38-40 synthase